MIFVGMYILPLTGPEVHVVREAEFNNGDPARVKCLVQPCPRVFESCELTTHGYFGIRTDFQLMLIWQFG